MELVDILEDGLSILYRLRALRIHSMLRAIKIYDHRGVSERRRDLV